MNIILDTHIFLWVLSQPEKLDKIYIDHIQNNANTIYISSISVAEIAIKSSIGKLAFDFDAIEIISESGFETLDFTVDDAVVLCNLPFYHRDPFDSMLIAQSLSNSYFIISDDEKFKLYDCRLL